MKTELKADKYYDFHQLLELKCKDCGGLCKGRYGYVPFFLHDDLVAIPVDCTRCDSGYLLNISLV